MFRAGRRDLSAVLGVGEVEAAPGVPRGALVAVGGHPTRRLKASMGASLGAAAGTDEVPGYRHDRWDIDLGTDEAGRFERSVTAVLDWAPQRGAGMRIFPDQPVTPDLTFMLVAPLPVGFVVAGVLE